MKAAPDESGQDTVRPAQQLPLLNPNLLRLILLADRSPTESSHAGTTSKGPRLDYIAPKGKQAPSASWAQQACIQV